MHAAYLVGSVLAVALARADASGDSASCERYPQCTTAGLAGNCCPSDAGERLACCGADGGTGFNPGEGGGGSGFNPGEGPVPAPVKGAADPGACAVDITAGIASITSAAKFITYATDDCPSGTKSACADSINSAITDFAGASKAISKATSSCGGMDTACSTDIINTIASLSASSETLICAASDCNEDGDGYDAFACIVDIFDTTDTLVHFSKSIYDAVDSCRKPLPKQMCDKKTAGQTEVVVMGCQGHGCNANGDDNDCAWCVTDLSTCAAAFGHDSCQATKDARKAQGVDCTGMEDIVPTRRLAVNV